MIIDPVPTSDQFIQSLARGLSVITCFDADHPEMTLSEVATRIDLSRATTRRFLHTLVDLGYIRTDGRIFCLTPRVLRLGTSYLSSFSLPQLAQPHLETLSTDLGESTSAAVLDGKDIAYVARVATRRIMTVGISVGTRFPAHATSMGRVLLASLSPDDLTSYLASTGIIALTPSTVTDPAALRSEIDVIRRQGWAVVDQELERGLRSVAAPVVDVHGSVIAAINVSASASSDLKEFTESTVPRLLRAARAVSADVAETAQFASLTPEE